LIAFHLKSQGVASDKVQFVAKGFGQNDATGLIECNFAAHIAIMWFEPFDK